MNEKTLITDKINIKNLEENYCWYLKKIQDNDDNLYLCEEIELCIEIQLKEIEKMLSSPAKYYKELKINVIKSNLLLGIGLFGIASFLT